MHPPAIPSWAGTTLAESPGSLALHRLGQQSQETSCWPRDCSISLDGPFPPLSHPTPLWQLCVWLCRVISSASQPRGRELFPYGCFYPGFILSSSDTMKDLLIKDSAAALAWLLL